jgi:hypothetical protein
MFSEHEFSIRVATAEFKLLEGKKDGTNDERFQVATWGGHLCVTGDMGDYLFKRSDVGILGWIADTRDIDYIHSKLVAPKVAKEFSLDLFKLRAQEYAVGFIREHIDSMSLDTLRRFLEKFDDVMEVGTPHEAMEAAASFTFNEVVVLGHDMLRGCEAYNSHFLWCVDAAKWAALRYIAGR